MTAHLTESQDAELSVVDSDEAVCVVQPLLDEVLRERPADAGHGALALAKDLEEQGRVVEQRSDGNLNT